MKIRLYILLACVFLSQHMMAVYYSVNIDYKTAAAMLAAYNAEGAVELMGDESVRTMLKHYKNAEIATAGIFLTKYMGWQVQRCAGECLLQAYLPYCQPEYHPQDLGCGQADGQIP